MCSQEEIIDILMRVMILTHRHLTIYLMLRRKGDLFIMTTYASPYQIGLGDSVNYNFKNYLVLINYIKWAKLMLKVIRQNQIAQY